MLTINVDNLRRSFTLTRRWGLKRKGIEVEYSEINQESCMEKKGFKSMVEQASQSIGKQFEKDR